MHTARLLTVSRSNWGSEGGGVWPREGVWQLGRGVCPGISVCSENVSAQVGVGSAHVGVCLGGVCIPVCNRADTPHPNEQND